MLFLSLIFVASFALSFNLQNKSIEVWTKPLAAYFNYATAIFNKGNDGTPTNVTIRVRDLGTNYDTGNFYIHNVWMNKDYPGMYSFLYDWFSVMVNPNGVVLLHLTPVV